MKINEKSKFFVDSVIETIIYTNISRFETQLRKHIQTREAITTDE